MRLLLLLLLMLPPATPNVCGPGACMWYSDTSYAGAQEAAGVQECGRTSDPNSLHTAANEAYPCYHCLAGRYQPYTTYAYHPTAYGGCIACGAGRYSSSTGASSCIACGVGRYSGSTSSSS